jgi:hypothetical protein
VEEERRREGVREEGGRWEAGGNEKETAGNSMDEGSRAMLSLLRDARIAMGASARSSAGLITCRRIVVYTR